MEFPKPFSITNDVWMVPCKIAHNKRLFKPISKPLDQFHTTCSKKSRNIWSQTEDKILIELVNSNGARNWSSTAKEINIALHNSLPTRTGKQCRERWHNQLNPLIKKSLFSPEEDELLLSLQKKIGNKWREISEFFIGRTENHIKNRWKKLKRGESNKFVQLGNIKSKSIKEQNTDKINYQQFSGKNSPNSFEDIDKEDFLEICFGKSDNDIINNCFLSIEDILPALDDELDCKVIESSRKEQGENFESWKGFTTDIGSEEGLWFNHF